MFAIGELYLMSLFSVPFINDKEEAKLNAGSSYYPFPANVNTHMNNKKKVEHLIVGEGDGV